ncbi:MAG: O-antigen ligase family protein [Anaerolineales bacterium]|nr:O-antigen ligase family protein [Anaerolineales bacterium]
MATRISRYAESLMEAAWLAAIIIVPVFFNIFSSRIFEPDKITLLRTLALAILGAWVVKLFEEGGIRWDKLKSSDSTWKTLRSIPLFLPVIALVVVYLLATIFSVTPRVSLAGSYQRLQGTYTTFSYLVIFAAMAANLRRRAQVERLITMLILSSLPVSLYGILQRYKLDPIPWGGDVTIRIASNMGNSIFVGAYFIMVFPLLAMRIIESFEALLGESRSQLLNLLRATAYIFIAALQVIALYLTQSRGPWLGWAASLVFLWLGVSLIWKKRWMTIAGVVLAVLGAGFLITLNIPKGPLAELASVPGFSRLSDLLDAESRTGKVRTLIWSGAVELVSPHEPLEFPDGSQDTFNFLRPLIGYGPEAMYVAYNPFYPPELTLVEKRNASPDRSHNETWDSLVITGAAGLAVYLVLFGSVMYFGLKWLGLVGGKRQRNLYLGLYIGGGVLSTLIFVLWKGLPFLGVALPFGMIMGVILYLIIMAIIGRFENPRMPGEKLRAYVLLGLLAAVVAHYAEINFGIAIASTRTYFWTYSALLLLVGYILPRYGEYEQISTAEVALPLGKQSPVDQKQPLSPKERRKANERKSSASAAKRRRSTRTSAQFVGLFSREWLRQAFIMGLILAILLSTLGYSFITNSSQSKSTGEIFWRSWVRMNSSGTQASYGLLALLLITWVMGAILLVSQNRVSRIQEEPEAGEIAGWLKETSVTLGVSIFIALIYWLWHAAELASLARTPASTIEQVMEQVKSAEGILGTFYLFLFLLIFGLAYSLVEQWPARRSRSDLGSLGVGLGVLIITALLVSYTNLRVIQADITFKSADLFARGNTWPISIQIYNRANELAPNEDYYYLFLGRAYLEYGRTLTDTAERDQLISQAANDLRKAQDINPLNTDHTANLARLYSLWAANTTDAVIRQERAAQSEEYFSQAVVLSPNSARIWDEWALLYLNTLQLPDEGYQRLTRALEIDPYYDWTYGLLGDYYARYIASAADIQPEAKTAALLQAAENYSQALKLAGAESSSLKLNYAIALGSIYSQLGDSAQAIAAYEQALQMSADNTDAWRIQEALARLYAQIGDPARALEYARQALNAAPDDQKERLQELITQLGGLP